MIWISWLKGKARAIYNWRAHVPCQADFSCRLWLGPLFWSFTFFLSPITIEYKYRSNSHTKYISHIQPHTARKLELNTCSVTSAILYCFSSQYRVSAL
jgi:hypothetical protein